MSCQIKGFAKLIDPGDVKIRLLHDADIKLDHVPRGELPLQDCLISLSSSGDVLAMALHQNLVILTSKWDLQEPGEIKNKFHVSWNGSLLNDLYPNEFITSVICLPLITYGKSSVNNGPDWTCIAVGFSTGFIRFYTETGALLLEEQLHSESVLGIKCQSLTSPRFVGDAGLSEEIHVLFNTVVCIIQGFPLFSTLRGCRNHLARVQANCWQTTSQEKPPNLSLTFKKLGFKDQDITNDCQVIGTTSVNTFDHLMTASICGGYNTSYRSGAPQHNLIMATGKRPYIGFHFALEGGTAPVLSDVAIAMASSLANAIGKIGTAVPWFRSSKTGQNGQEKTIKGPVNELAEPMTCRFGLSDVMREGDCIVMSPNKALSVITDAMGRVILVNNRRGIALRMWKGYRDAQCGWIEVTEDKHRSKLVKEKKSPFSNSSQSSKSSPGLRTALFLAIYAPKKGVIDIWGIQQGGKITTFSASKNGRLIYTNYGLLGFNDSAPTSGNKSNKPQYSSIFIDPLGGLREIIVPFHFALSSKNGKRARDIHLFKKLKTFLREEEFDDEQLIQQIACICSELKTNEIRLQILEMLMTNRHIVPDALLPVVNSFINILIQYEEDELEPAGKSLYHISIQLQKVIEFYKFVRSQFDRPPEYSTVASSNIPDSKYVASVLLTSEREIHRTLKLSNSLHEIESLKTQPRVTFKEEDDNGARIFPGFISCFDFGSQNTIGLNRETSEEKKYQIGSLIYQGWMYSSETTTDWEEAAHQSNIRPKTLIELALIYWLKKRPGAPLEVELTRLTQLLYAICGIGDNEDLAFEYNMISSWWRDVRNILIDSTRPFQALTAALACRAVGITLQMNRDCVYSDGVTTDDNDNGNNEKIVKKENKGREAKMSAKKSELTTAEEGNQNDNNLQSSSGGWENVSKDTCQFTLLIGNLEDISILSVVLTQAPPLIESFLALPFEKQEISLGNIVARGRGSVSESVAKWLSSSGIDPAKLVDTSDVEFDWTQHPNHTRKSADSQDETTGDQIEPKTSKEEKEYVEEFKVNTEAEINSPVLTQIIDKISLLKRHFPYSLTSSVLLANLCWEYVVFWSKDVSRLDSLEAALAILRQIPMKSMRQGVCCLLWTIHIKKKMEAAAKLMNKLGKLPKERLCIQEVGLTDTQLTILLQHCVTFLDIFLDAEVLEAEKSSVIRSEELWEGHGTGPQPFATLAITQTPAWYDLVMLHLQLANVLHMIANFNLKSTKPMTNLFESVTSRYFFQDITDKAIITWYRDERRDDLRVEFLCRIITASMDSIQQETDEENTIKATQAIEWMGKCHDLASIWKIDNDKLRIHQVCQLYINGFDRLADEIFTAVNDTETLAASLLPIAGRRMMSYLSKTPDLLEEVSRMNPALSQYLENLDCQGVVLTSCSNEDTIELIRKVSRHLPEKHNDYHYAQLMLDATFIYEGNK